jgi:CRISPR-associated endonuclease/helicase Cas3
VSELTASRFEEFFRALHRQDRSPFPWQKRLAERACSGTWPRVIALPTAAGKTTCIDIALFALACQAGKQERIAPRRIFFVVDRRVIVDQAFEHACKIGKRLEESDAPILREVAQRLRGLGCSDRPLDCFQLRGGIYRDDAWARTPLQPTVIASTVDQIGSRLLYRGYGLRTGLARPIHAALAANDSLILLDEAHCSVPFSQTAEWVQLYRRWAETAISSPFHFVQMTATFKGDIPDTAILADNEDDRNDLVLGKRIDAKKPTRLVVAEKAKGKDWRKHLVAELVNQAEGLMEDPVRAVGIIVNRVATARETSRILANRNSEADVVLLTGRMRPLDRDRVVARWLRQLEVGSTSSLERPVFVVATQCLEVGADLDFHALVSECASLDALRQRFGRLNRVAARDVAPGVVVVRADQVAPEDKEEEQDPVYGNSLAHTWEWLHEQAKEQVIDMGTGALRERLEALDSDRRAAMMAPSLDAPVLFPAHLDCWVQTAPSPQPDPDPAVFLHGPQSGIPDVQVVWRTDLPLDGSEDDWKQIVSLCPPSSSEAMPVPLPAFRSWLGGKEGITDGSDVEGIPGEIEGEAQGDPSRRVLRWSGPDADATALIDWEILKSRKEEIRPGDTLVIPASERGWEVLGDIPQGEHSWLDLGDQAYLRSRDLALLRLTPRVLEEWPAELRTTALSELLTSPTFEEDEGERDQRLTDVLGELAGNALAPDWLQLAAKSLGRAQERLVEGHPAGGWVIRGKRRLHPKRPVTAFTDEDDSASELAGVGSGGVPLARHCQEVEGLARKLAAGCGLPESIIETIGWAARWHDLGKADRRFQAWLRCLPRRAIRPDSPLWAKSEKAPSSARGREHARQQSGYPRGGRHELLSVRLAESRLGTLPSAIDRDLLLHLIVSHHGHGRPFAPVVDDPAPEAVAEFCHLGERFSANSTATHLERLESGVAERFWKLVRRYGWWGLAYLETILRLADHRQSEREQGAEGAKRE